MSDRSRLRAYRPRLGDGLASVYQPRAIRRHRFGISPLRMLTICIIAAPALYVAAVYVMPLFLVVISALARGE